MRHDDLNRVMGLPGWCSAEKAERIYAIAAEAAKSLSPPGGVEIGVYGGRSLAAFAYGLRDAGRGGFILGVDPYSRDAVCESVPEDDGFQGWMRGINWDEFYELASYQLKALNLEHYCGVVRSPANAVWPVFGFASLDYLHVDGNHAEAVALRDVQNYLPAVRRGGTVVLDDTCYPGLDKARAYVSLHCELRHAGPDNSYEVYTAGRVRSVHDSNTSVAG